MGRKAILGWAGLMTVAVIGPAAAQTPAGGLTQPVCLSFGLAVALTITPVESLVRAFQGLLPGDN